MTKPRPVDRWLTAMQMALCVVAPVFLVVGFGVAVYEYHFLRHAARSNGVVLQMEEVVSTDTNINSQSTTYAPVFRFRVGMVDYTVHSNSGTNPPAFAVGQSVAVLYDPSDPQHAQIQSWGEQWGFALGFCIAGLVTGLVGIVMRLVRGPKNFWDYVPFADGASR